MTTIRFTVPGEPVPKGRPRCSCVGGKPRLRTPTATRSYENAVHATATLAGIRRLSDGPLDVSMVIVVPRLKSTPKKTPGRVRHASRPDIDNYAKAVIDGALNGSGIDDGRVWRLSVEAWRAAAGEDPHVDVMITDEVRDAQGVR